MEPFSLLAALKVAGLVVTPWKIVGWIGNLIFSTRFIYQWLASERAKRSVIPAGFWLLSTLGSLFLLAYFGFYRRDSVGVISTVFPLPIYLRNLYLQLKHRHPVHPGNEPRVAQ